MADSFREVLQEAKKNKFSNIWAILSDNDVADVWDGVSAFVQKNLSQQKGVVIPGFGTFTFTQVKLDVGNNKFAVSQRPVFILSEKFVKTHGLRQKKYTVPGGLPVVQLNLAQLSIESQRSFNRDTIDTCVREVHGALSRCVASGRPVEFTFSGIGRLLIRDSVVKMKFLKSFIRQWDGSGKLVDSLQGRPSTADSVMSGRLTARNRPTSVLALPRECCANGVGKSGEIDKSALPPICEDSEENLEATQTVDEEVPEQDGCCEVKFLDVNPQNGGCCVQVAQTEDDIPGAQSKEAPASCEGRVALAIPQATAFSWDDPTTTGPVAPVSRHSPIFRSKTTLSNGDVIGESRAVTSRSLDATSPPSTAASCRSSASSCGHSNSGQELCYLCHQRARRNVVVSFAEERRRQEEEENRLLSDFQQYRDAVDMHKEQEKLLAKRHESQKTATYNLTAGEAHTAVNRAKDDDYFPSFVFRKRPLTPPSFLKQEKYRDELVQQMAAQGEDKRQKQSEEEFLGRLEQVQLAEDIAAQRQYYLQQKAEKTEAYKRGLSAQLKIKAESEQPPCSPEPLYFASDIEARDEVMQEKRRRANELFQEQVALVEQRKRDAILKRFEEQKHDEDVLRRNKRDTLVDAAERYERLSNNRRTLEDDWRRAAEKKQERDADERRGRFEPDKSVVLDQCARYRRCGQCRRRLENRGQTNVWCETRYVPGCRIMV